MTYKAVVIGCGFIGSRYNEGPAFDPQMTHAAACAAHPKVELAGVCDPDPARAGEAAAFWKTDGFSDAAQIVQQISPDIVCIATPTQAHAAMLRLALDMPSVRGIFCEKPLTDGLAESRALVAEAAEKGVALAVNYTRRYDAGHRAAREMIASGRIGKIRMARGLYVRGLLHNGSHMIDLYRWLFGEVTAVRAEPDEAASVEKSLSGFLEFESGVRAWLHGMDAPSSETLFEVDIIGETGRLVLSLNGNDIRLWEPGDSAHYPGFTTFNRDSVVSDGIRGTGLAAIDNLVECMEKGKGPVCSGHDGIRAVEIAEALADSARTGKIVTTDEHR